MGNNYSEDDVKLFNLLRCEPPNMAFDYFGYGGLTKSVLTLLDQNIPNLEQRIVSMAEKNQTVVNMSHSEDEDEDEHKKHFLSYNYHNGVFSMMANSYNQFSGKSDIKHFGRAHIKGTDGKEYTANLLALEVYRGKGNPHFEIGFYITDDFKNIVYGEATMFNLADPEKDGVRLELKRNSFNSLVCQNLSKMLSRSYDTKFKGINRTNTDLVYLNDFMNRFEDSLVGHEEFNKTRSSRMRYLQGTNAVKNVLKFEDRFGYKIGFRTYRVQLLSSHLNSKNSGRFNVFVLANTEGDSERPNEKVVKDGFNLPNQGEYSHSEAINRFLKMGNSYLAWLYNNAGKGEPQFNITIDSSHIDFRYATILSDANKNSIAVSSWETPYMPNGLPYLDGMINHYLQIWNMDPMPLRLEEGVHFKKGMHPRQFMKKIVDVMPKIKYENGSDFVKKCIDLGVPLIG